MYNKLSFTALCISFCFFLMYTSCRQDPDLEGLPVVSYKSHIAPILSSNCTFSGCHNGSKFSLATYNDLMSNGGVTPFNAHKSKFYKSIINKGAEAMPPSGYSALSNDNIKLIYVWLEQGAKDN